MDDTVEFDASDRQGPHSPGTRARFPATLWTKVIGPAGTSSPAGRDALERLCQMYWFPLYAFIRSKGNDRSRAEDLTQGFFQRLLEKRLWRNVDRRQGRFRAYLCKACENFLKDRRRSEMAQIRRPKGGLFSIDEQEAEERYNDLPFHEPEPTKTFDRAWAATIIERANADLRRAYTRRGKADLFDALKACLTSQLKPDAYANLAARLGMTRPTLEVNISRMKVGFSEAVRRVVAQTVSPAEIDNEIRYLMAAWVSSVEAVPPQTKRA